MNNPEKDISNVVRTISNVIVQCGSFFAISWGFFILLKNANHRCRSRVVGFEYMEGVEQTDGPVQEEPVDDIDAPGNNKITLPIEADFLYAYSTVPGYYSWRNSVRGSWFVQAIVSVFRENATTMDVLRMMTRVNAEVAKQKSNTNEYFSDNKKQIPSIITQLRKELYFFPENVLDGQP